MNSHMKLRNLALIGVAVLVAVCCVLAAGCTSTHSSDDLSDKIIAALDENLKTIFNEEESLYESGDSYNYLKYSSSSGSFESSDGFTISYNAIMNNDVRTLIVTFDGKEYTLQSSPVLAAGCGDWSGENELLVNFEENGCGSYSYPNDEYLHYFFWGKNDDGTYTILFTDHTTRTLTASGDTLTDSTGLVLKKEA